MVDEQRQNEIAGPKASANGARALKKERAATMQVLQRLPQVEKTKKPN
jgi:hypothetical protein